MNHSGHPDKGNELFVGSYKASTLMPEKIDTVGGKVIFFKRKERKR